MRVAKGFYLKKMEVLKEGGETDVGKAKIIQVHQGIP